MSPSTLSTVNTILDLVLVAASIWMVITIRGLGGIIGSGLNLVAIGAVILGAAHLLSTLIQNTFLNTAPADPMMAPMSMNTSYEGLIHRVFVLIGFAFLGLGFRQIGLIKK